MKPLTLGALVASAFAPSALAADPLLKKKPLDPWGFDPGSGSYHGPDVVMVDAGSSGSKVFAFCPSKAQGKLRTVCSDAKKKAGMTNKGIAALAYSKPDCEWQIGPSGKKLVPLARQQPDYVEALLKLLGDTYASASGKPDLSRITNSDAVPMLATAGMRLLSQPDNDRVWSFICGKSAYGFKLAEAGEKCGTIPGTTEAYYEFLANAVKGRASRLLTGTFTIGGASAQISIPLKTPQDVKDFNALKASVAADLDCTQLKLADGNAAPVFNRVRQGGPTKDCVDDYITYRPKTEIRASADVKANSIKTSEIEGIGLISFLGLQGRGTFVAGGVNAIQNWAVQEGCDKKTSDFASCVVKLKAALSRDVMWRHVTQYFRDKALNVDNFSFNTAAAHPGMAGLPVGKGPDQAWKLKEELNVTCSKDLSKQFGYEDSNTCMKALYTSMYTTAFFVKDSGDENRHNSGEIFFDWKRDWVEGKLQEMSLLATGRRVWKKRANTHVHRKLHAHIQSFLNVPIQRHSASYMEGLRIHLAANGSGPES